MGFQQVKIGESTPSGDINAKREELCELIRELSFSEGAVQLAFGGASDFYFNMKMTMSQPRGLFLIAELMLEELRKDQPDYIGGLEMGAIPILNAVSLQSHVNGCDLPLFWIRKKPKEHGSMAMLEGVDLAQLIGKTAVMVDDVTTTGNSVLKAIREAREQGVEINKVLTIVDRQQGARENLAEYGVELVCLYDASEFRL